MTRHALEISAPFVARAEVHVLRRDGRLGVESTRTVFPLCPRSAGCLDERALRASPDRPLTSSRAGVIASMPTSSDRFRVPAKPRLPSEMLVHVRRGNSLGELSAIKERSTGLARTIATTAKATVDSARRVPAMCAQGTIACRCSTFPLSPVRSSHGACRALTFGQLLPLATGNFVASCLAGPASSATRGITRRQTRRGAP